MKRLCFASLFVVTVFSAVETNAQLGWNWQNPLPQGNMLTAVCFTDANTGTAVGVSGTVLRTTNGGTNWTSQSSGITADLCGVALIGTNAGTAVGKGWGVVLRTTNGGGMWTLQWSAVQLLGVSFADSSTGTAVGSEGGILRTTEGGAQWTSQ